jgi:UDP-glucose:(heptosyl)LPS alpha-1,3-glucosyltransferase
MIPIKPKPRLAVVSPFLDKRHGSERITIEWLSHLPHEFDIHVYSQRVEDFDESKFTWHRIPKLPGPHLLNFLWWVAANRLWRYWDARFRGLRHDLVFSAGVNCLDADAICVHIVFAEYTRLVRGKMRFLRNPIWDWPRLLHRKLYYGITGWMEHRAYKNYATTLVVYSRKTAREVEQFYGRDDDIPVLYLGLDHSVFNTTIRAALRGRAREALKLAQDQFTLILVGNDWRNKGVPALLDALVYLRDLPVGLLIVSREDQSSCWRLVTEKRLEDRMLFLPPRKDIEFYYAAADAYVGPSLQESYGIPPAEAMACGLPVIVSAAAGVSEIVTNDVDGMVLDDPTDAIKLAAMIRRLYEDKEFCKRLGKNASETARRYTWESNGRDLAAIFEEILRRKSGLAARTLTQEL